MENKDPEKEAAIKEWIRVIDPPLFVQSVVRRKLDKMTKEEIQKDMQYLLSVKSRAEEF